MSKIRIYELAKQLGIANKELMGKLKDFGIEATSHMSMLNEEESAKVTAFFKPQKAEEKTGNAQEKKPAQETTKEHNRKPANETRNASKNQNAGHHRQERQGEEKKSSGFQRPNDNRSGEKTGFNRHNDERKQSNRPNDNRSGERRQNQNNAPHLMGESRSANAGQNRRNEGHFDRNHGNADRNDRRNNDRADRNERSDRNNDRRNNYNNTGKPNKNGKGSQNHRQREDPMERRRREREEAEARKAQEAAKTAEAMANAEPEIKQVPVNLTVKELAEILHKKGSELVTMLMKKGMMLNINAALDFDTASEIAEQYNVILEQEEEKDIIETVFGDQDQPDAEENLKERPPVVVVMGHVDHGKTSLLDAIRHSNVTKGEAGGITQHIGAYTVQINGKPITFLDTPGHEAFTAMRMRGAQVTDIAVLVVAADDGVMPQTAEAINHAKAAGVEIIVAINKMDKPSANPERVKQELVEYGLQAEDWGGDTICVPVSAVTKEGIDQLLEMITLVAEMKELKANPDRPARGAIIEAKLDRGRGPVATVLVQNGTLQVGDPVVAGAAYGKIRAMTDDKGRRVKKAGPSTPVEILGLSEVPSAGDTFYVAESEKQARMVAETIVAKNRENLIRETPQKVSLDDLFSQIQSGTMKELNIVVKADVQGSVEAVRQSLERLSNEEVRVCIIHGGVGAITESDVMLASASNAIIIGFNVRLEPAAKTFADAEKVDVRLYRVIYNAIEDVSAAMKGMLDPVFEEKVIGHAEIRQLFKASGVGTIAGAYVKDGKFTRSAQVRILRDNIVVYEVELESLKRFKDDVKEVTAGFECGFVFKKYNDIKEGDWVEAFVMEEIPRT